MQNNDPTVQFMPFDALKGFKEEIKKVEKVKVDYIDITEDEANYLNDVIYDINKRDLVEVIFYNNDGYYKIKGLVSNLNLTYKTITIVKTKISFASIKYIKIIEKNSI